MSAGGKSNTLIPCPPSLSTAQFMRLPQPNFLIPIAMFLRHLLVLLLGIFQHHNNLHVDAVANSVCYEPGYYSLKPCAYHCVGCDSRPDQIAYMTVAKAVRRMNAGARPTCLHSPLRLSEIACLDPAPWAIGGLITLPRNASTPVTVSVTDSLV